MLIDASFGTLWWAQNSLWQQDPAFVVKKGAENDFHPCVSLLKEGVRNNIVVPMLLGRSKRLSFNRSVVFKMDDDKEKTTTFGSMKPLDFDFWSFLNGSMHPNEKKKKLSETELSQLEDFIRRKLQW